MRYKSVVVSRFGGPEVLQVVENELRPPAPGQVRIRVLASSICQPDITVRSGKALYSGTPLGQSQTRGKGTDHRRQRRHWQRFAAAW